MDGICRDSSTPTPTATPLPTCVVDADCPDGQQCLAAAMVCVPPRECDDSDPLVDRLQCRGVREACINNTCECGGDCNLNGIVFGTEITHMVCILGGQCDLSICEAGDVNGDGVVTGCDVSLAVLNLGLGCPGEGTPLLFGESRADETRTITIGRDDLEGAPGQFVDVDIAISGGTEGDDRAGRHRLRQISAQRDGPDDSRVSACEDRPSLGGQVLPGDPAAPGAACSGRGSSGCVWRWSTFSRRSIPSATACWQPATSASSRPPRSTRWRI